MNLDKLILASSSPRRRELIKAFNIPFSVFKPEVDELITEEEPEALVQIAVRKARAFPGEGVVVAADTAVVFENKFLGKPGNEEAAYEMLLALRSRTHHVITAVAAVLGDRVSSTYCSTLVTMRDYTEDEAWAYVASGSPMDKAGGYAIQDRNFYPVASYEGCYLNVVGLPLCTLVGIIRELGFCIDNFNKPQECQGCHSEDLL